MKMSIENFLKEKKQNAQYRSRAGSFRKLSALSFYSFQK